MYNPNEIKMSQDQIELLIEGQKELKKSNDLLSVHILQLTTVIRGNELDRDDKGMIGDLREQNLRIANLEKDNEKAKADKKSNRKYIAGFALATTIFWGIIQLLVNYFSNHQH